MSEKIEIDWLSRWATYSPKKVAIKCVDSNRSFTYLELFERASQLAGILKAKFEISKGDRVAVYAYNEPETIFLFFALQRLGAILVPVNFRYTAREVDHVVEDSKPKLVVSHSCFAPIMEKVDLRGASSLSFDQGECLVHYLFNSKHIPFNGFEGEFEDEVVILYTSGTTGAPKGALISHKMLFWNSINTGMRLNITSSDVTPIFHPLFHTSGWNVLTTPFFHHGAQILMLKKFDAAKILELVERENVSILFGVPTMMDMMARAPSFTKTKLNSLRFAIVGGEPMPIDLIDIWAERGVPIRQGYGLTEFGPNVFSLNAEDAVRKSGSIGFPNFYVDIKLIDIHGQELSSVDEVGELCLRGPMCTSGYWQNPEATKKDIVDGWFHTGDLVRRDADGFFYVVGRKKEMFISGAENVYPAEVEKFLRTHEGIREVAVVGVPDKTWGEVGKCYYASEDGAPMREDELKSFCQTGLAKYKVPKYFVHLAELPKGDSGKILKRALLEN